MLKFWTAVPIASHLITIYRVGRSTCVLSCPVATTIDHGGDRSFPVNSADCLSPVNSTHTLEPLFLSVCLYLDRRRSPNLIHRIPYTTPTHLIGYK
jgi:hypothetical protein